MDVSSIKEKKTRERERGQTGNEIQKEEEIDTKGKKQWREIEKAVLQNSTN